MVWLVLCILFILTLAIMLVPLYRYQRNTAPATPVTKNIAVYKAQLAELQSDLDNGVLSAAEVTAARLEIERRLLRISSETEHSDPEKNEVSSRFLMTVILLVLFGSTAFYQNIGTPGMPDFALENQAHSTAQKTNENSAAPDMVAELAKIQAHLIENPDDVEAWRAKGQLHTELQDKASAAEAFQHWFEHDPNNIEAAVVFSESLIMLSNGRVSPAARLALERARKMQPDNPGVRHYMALAEYQAGNVGQALANWRALITDSPMDAPWRGSVQHWIGQAQNDLGLPLTNSAPVAPPLSAESRKAIAEMSAEEQEAMINNMVARLAQKMRDNPENIEGWFRLAKAYMMLGQRSNALKSLKQAEKYAPDTLKPEIKKQLEILLK